MSKVPLNIAGKDLPPEERDASHPNIRPKDAATLVLLDRSKGDNIRVLMGRRSLKHAFFPGMFVFPGGRVDPADSNVPIAADYDPMVETKMMTDMRNAKTAARARALSVAAIREAYEEAGLFIGTEGTGLGKRKDWQAFAERKLLPDLSGMRLLARAITPPRRIRRFDTRFIAAWSDVIVDRLPEGTGPTGELEDLHWLTLKEARELDLPAITKVILDELDARLKEDPELSPDGPAPFFAIKGKEFLRRLI